MHCRVYQACQIAMCVNMPLLSFFVYLPLYIYCLCILYIHPPTLPRLGDAPFILVVNLMIPGPPFLSLVFSWGAEIDPESMPADSTADSQSVATSIAGDNSDEDDLSLTSPVDRALARYWDIGGGYIMKMRW